MTIPTLSVVIITKNEQDNVKKCLESIKWANEVIILDSGSADKTVEICKHYTNQVYSTDWPGFGIQKQRALDLSTGDWVLSIDADEIVSLQLKNEILEKIKSKSNVDAYLIPRLSWYQGKCIRHSGWYPDYVLRLAKRSTARFTPDKVHERLKVSGTVGKLSSDILHYPYRNISHHIQKMNTYSSLSAEQMFAQGRKVNWILVILKPSFAFFRAYILKQGFLDGWPGLSVSISTALSVYLKYVKLKELNDTITKSKG